MPTTYLDLCNQVLRRLNEVQIAPADFAGVRGVQALVKDAVQSAVAKVNQAKDDNLNADFKALRFLDRDEWYQKHRDDDYEAGASGRGIPDYVFPSHGSGYGVSPVPDAAYTLKFRYFLNFTDLTNFNDLTRIPSAFDTMIVDGALYHMYMFKDNPESASVAFQAFERGLKDLQSIYVNDYQYIRDRRVNFGGGQRRFSAYTPVRF